MEPIGTPVGHRVQPGGAGRRGPGWDHQARL